MPVVEIEGVGRVEIEGDVTPEKIEEVARSIQAQTPQPQAAPQPRSGMEANLLGLLNQQSGAQQGIVPSKVGQPIGEIIVDDREQAFVKTSAGQIPFSGEEMVYQYGPEGKLFAYPREGVPTESRAVSGMRAMLPGYMSQAPIVGRASQGMTGAQAAGRALEQTGIPNTPINRGGSIPAFAGGAVSRTLGGGPVMEKAVERTTQAAAQAGDNLAMMYGAASNADDAGRLVQEGVAAFRGGQAKTLADRIYRPFDEAMSATPDAQFSLDNFKQVLSGPKYSAPELKGLFESQKAQDILARIEKVDTVGLGDIKQLRSDIGELVGDMKGPGADFASKQIDAMYAALSRDIETGLAASNPQALAAWKAANPKFALLAKRNLNFQKKLMQGTATNNPEAAFSKIRTALTGKTKDLTLIRDLRRSLSDGEFNGLVASVVKDLGSPTRSAPDVIQTAGFDITQFAKSVGEMSDRAKNVMFGGASDPRRQMLDNMVKAGRAIEGSKRYTNWSNSLGSGANLSGLAALAEPAYLSAWLGMQAGAMLTAGVLTRQSAQKMNTIWQLSRKVQTARDVPLFIARINRIAQGSPEFMPLLRGLERPVAEDEDQQAQPR